LRGAELFPWCATLAVDAAEANALRAHRAIQPRPVEPPSWALPSGFPDPRAPVRALHDGALVAMLRERNGELVGERALHGAL
jgi:tRNA pseudouridine55 synthase